MPSTKTLALALVLPCFSSWPWTRSCGAFASASAVNTLPPSVTDAYFDCQLRQLALEFAEDVILKPWGTGAADAWVALDAIQNGLLISHCPSPPVATSSSTTTSNQKHQSPDQPAASQPASAVNKDTTSPQLFQIFVSVDGNDSKDGLSPETALATVGGAQKVIRNKFPNVSQRPMIQVNIAAGDYFLPPTRTIPTGNHVENTNVFSNHATFSDQDSGSALETPIIYTGDPNGGTTLHGGVVFSDLAWTPSSTIQNAWTTTLPPNTSISPMDQVFAVPKSIRTTQKQQHKTSGFSSIAAAAATIPLVRARFPNGKPWIPMDGFNLTAGTPISGPLPGIPRMASDCAIPKPSVPNPSPLPRPPPPQPYPPKLDTCTAAPVENVSLLYGFPGPDQYLADANASSPEVCSFVTQP